MTNDQINDKLTAIAGQIHDLLKAKHQYEKLKLFGEITAALDRFEQKTDTVCIEVMFQHIDVLDLLNDNQKYRLFEVLKEMLKYQRKDLEDEINGNGNDDP